MTNQRPVSRSHDRFKPIRSWVGDTTPGPCLDRAGINILMKKRKKILGLTIAKNEKSKI